MGCPHVCAGRLPPWAPPAVASSLVWHVMCCSIIVSGWQNTNHTKITLYSHCFHEERSSAILRSRICETIIRSITDKIRAPWERGSGLISSQRLRDLVHYMAFTGHPSKIKHPQLCQARIRQGFWLYRRQPHHHRRVPLGEEEGGPLPSHERASR